MREVVVTSTVETPGIACSSSLITAGPALKGIAAVTPPTSNQNGVFIIVFLKQKGILHYKYLEIPSISILKCPPVAVHTRVNTSGLFV